MTSMEGYRHVTIRLDNDLIALLEENGITNRSEFINETLFEALSTPDFNEKKAKQAFILALEALRKFRNVEVKICDQVNKKTLE